MHIVLLSTYKKKPKGTGDESCNEWIYGLKKKHYKLGLKMAMKKDSKN